MQDPTKISDRDNGKVEIKHTTCYMCACRCGVRITLRDGEIRHIQGNPEHPLNKGVICAKGSSGVMKQLSPARLLNPLKRKEGSERGNPEFEVISWDEAFDLMEKRLGAIRSTDPKKFAMFTGRDQMQALTGMFAKNFGTPNFAAHGGFCSVNMATGMIYTMGGSFWEFGGPDLERAKLFVMIGTAEDHHSNPLKREIGHFKSHGGRMISVNPVRTGYSAVADQWIGIKPGTDAALFMAIINILIKEGLYDKEFLREFSNAAELVILDEGPEQGMLLRSGAEKPAGCFDPEDRMWYDRNSKKIVPMRTEGANPAFLGEYTTEDGKKVKPSFQLLMEQAESCTPEWAAEITGIPAETIRNLAIEMGVVARDERFELPIAWTDAWGRKHEKVTGVPVAFHAMRGLAAHSNGFQTIRGLAIIMSLLGTIDRPGGFRHRAPFPRPVPPGPKNCTTPEEVQPNTPLPHAPVGWPANPEELFLTAEGGPVRIDKAFSWEHPLSAHGLMQNVITNAWRGDPYTIDTLFLFMANMAWNSSMHTSDVRQMLTDKDSNGQYKIPFLIVADAYHSETVAFADLVLPDTTYLERYDVMSMLDRPISEFEGPVDACRVPIMPRKGDSKPFQDVLIELGSRLKFPAFTHADGSRKFEDYKDFITNFELVPGIGFLSGWRGKDGDKVMRGEPNPDQWKRYEENGCYHFNKLPESMHFMRNWNREYLDWAKENNLMGFSDPINIHLYSEILQTFRLAAQGKRPGRQPPDHLRSRVEKYFDPLPFYHPPLEDLLVDTKTYPYNALTQRPMAMYHSWDSQNAWLRQIHTYNYLYMSPQVGRDNGFDDGDWVDVESMHGKIRCMARFTEAVEPGTVWTWNAIGKSAGAWGLSKDAYESKRGFLLNHVISEELPAHEAGEHVSNSDPVTGQAAWFDVRVKITKAEDCEPVSQPQFTPMKAYPGMTLIFDKLRGYMAGKASKR
ncbi:molybdopterin oxidoreductase [Magnetococcus marinus MC-1]|uniref:Molybdopterin oxidoreductase n=1 Tax=Magnetococcus marinus (strain ATCC BAA-1437 / JCM 17883 / MC-1) TaxID=156889 RepID=A0L8L6_MAGMM|nr:molybdopterin oxidoreductase family protein [Magnetococcus marinus]ABK44309.1 molybdopterin oxidoreductase [Magnetococcus marinus MC-1]